MSKNRFITIENPTGIFVMINAKKEAVYLCNGCLKPSDNGYVENKNDCEHGAKEKEMADNRYQEMNDKTDAMEELL